jgi:predicted RNA-binding Zn ribbon-like protein
VLALCVASAVAAILARARSSRRAVRSGDLAAALSAVARSALDLWELDDHEVLRWCADGLCTRAFIDRSRGHRRRWCGIDSGNRAKARAYRARRRANA